MIFHNRHHTNKGLMIPTASDFDNEGHKLIIYEVSGFWGL